jgi:hypothetical protein
LREIEKLAGIIPPNHFHDLREMAQALKVDLSRLSKSYTTEE